MTDDNSDYVRCPDCGMRVGSTDLWERRDFGPHDIVECVCEFEAHPSEYEHAPDSIPEPASDVRAAVEG